MKKKHRPFTRQEVIHYEKKRYKGIDQRLVHARENHILAQLFKKIDNTPGTALDIPCGYGRFSNFLREKGFIPVSLDYSYQMVTRAVEASKNDHGSLGIAADAKKNLPFKSNSFNVLFSMRFFHHVHEPHEREFILKEFARVSQKWVVFSYYQTSCFHLFQRRLRKTFNKDQANIKMISRDELQSLSEKAGLKILRVIPVLKGIHSQNIALLSKSSGRQPGFPEPVDPIF